MNASRKPRASILLNTAYRAAKFASEVFAETLWPTRCALCDEPGYWICPRCERALPYIDTWKACPRCGAPFGSVQCSECNGEVFRATGKELPFTQMVSALMLDSQARTIITTYKDKGEQSLAGAIAELMAGYLPPSWLRQRPLLTYIPASKAALRRRGFDHMAVIARELAELTYLHCEAVFLPPDTADQRKLGRQERQANMEARLQIIPGIELPRTCLVIDDVSTTGATLNAAAISLKEAGVEAIYCATFAKTYA